MEESILWKLGKVGIGADEDVLIPLDDEDIRTGVSECSRSVIAFVLTLWGLNWL